LNQNERDRTREDMAIRRQRGVEEGVTPSEGAEQNKPRSYTATYVATVAPPTLRQRLHALSLTDTAAIIFLALSTLLVLWLLGLLPFLSTELSKLPDSIALSFSR
jgi:hypothetical protein